MAEQNRRVWDWHAARYQATHLHARDTIYYWSEAFPNEDDLQLLGNVAGLRVLDLGSGAGQSGIALAKRGALVTCVDISQSQLDIGQQYAAEDGVEVQFVQGDMQDLAMFHAQSFDLVVSCAALSYVEDERKVFQEVARVIVPGGKFVASVDEAFWLAIGAKYIWPKARESPAYFYRGPIEWRWEESDPKDYRFVMFRRPLQDYVNGLIDAGFLLDHMVELELIKERLPQDTFLAPPEIEFAHLYPLALVLVSHRKG
ncbi:MAG TPA: class I SAM-dependent methyltransferase [Candidatus Lokiarchaeia archaeon]|nr:class I SAM-dependent methyltransferase [Candidatus Lokiarchaeia archaeon]